MKPIKTLSILGEKWTITQTRSGGYFKSTKKQIGVDWKDPNHIEILIHEVLEYLLMRNLLRYYGHEASMEYVFILNHTEFCRVCKDLTNVLTENELIK